jgi:hypothetical protein
MLNHTLQIRRLRRFVCLMLLLGSVASASGQTVKERWKNDPDFKIYPVLFGVTATGNSTPPAVRLLSVGHLRGEREKGKIDIPDAWMKAAKKKIQAHPPEPKMKDGKPVEVFTRCFYVPGHPNIVVTELDKPLDKQP